MLVKFDVTDTMVAASTCGGSIYYDEERSPGQGRSRQAEAGRVAKGERRSCRTWLVKIHDSSPRRRYGIRSSPGEQHIEVILSPYQCHTDDVNTLERATYGMALADRSMQTASA